MDPMAAIHSTFFQKCNEQFATLETGLLVINAGEPDSETVNAIFVPEPAILKVMLRSTMAQEFCVGIANTQSGKEP